jgi:hypothetical protein
MGDQRMKKVTSPPKGTGKGRMTKYSEGYTQGYTDGIEFCIKQISNNLSQRENKVTKRYKHVSTEKV